MNGHTLVLSIVLAIAGLSAGCKDDGKKTPPGDQFQIREIRLEGTTRTPSAVQVGELNDADGKADTEWNARFALDGADAPGSLPQDRGGEQSHELLIKATRQSDGAELQKKVTITLHE